jgi:hypothetical protein
MLSPLTVANWAVRALQVRIVNVFPTAGSPVKGNVTAGTTRIT